MRTEWQLPFVKYQGLGNDFIIFLKADIAELDWPQLASQVCNRNFGIGADGMAIISPANNIRMDFFNSDGSKAPMCGNASRCISHWVKELGMIHDDKYILQTAGGDLSVHYNPNNSISVTLGFPKLEPADIPVVWEGRAMLDQALKVEGEEIVVTALYMTTPHLVVFVDKLEESQVIALGPKLESLKIFPQKINVNFVQIVNRDVVRLATWERGAGRTLACGTGACATVVAGYLTKRLSANVKVIMDGGELQINWHEKNGIMMTGDVQKIAQGVYYYYEQ